MNTHKHVKLLFHASQTPTRAPRLTSALLNIAFQLGCETSRQQEEARRKDDFNHDQLYRSLCMTYEASDECVQD